MVFVISKNKQPLAPTTNARARMLLKKGKALGLKGEYVESVSVRLSKEKITRRTLIYHKFQDKDKAKKNSSLICNV